MDGDDDDANVGADSTGSAAADEKEAREEVPPCKSSLKPLPPKIVTSSARALLTFLPFSTSSSSSWTFSSGMREYSCIIVCAFRIGDLEKERDGVDTDP